MSLKSKNALITGVSGFVGSRMARHLVEEGAKVFGMVRISEQIDRFLGANRPP